MHLFKFMMISGEATRPAFRWPTDLDEPRFFCDFHERAGVHLFGVKWYLRGCQYGQVLKLGVNPPQESALHQLEDGYRKAIKRFKRVFIKVPNTPNFLRRLIFKIIWKWAQWGQGCGVRGLSEALGL